MEKVADGVWLLRGDPRKAMNIYFLEDGEGWCSSTPAPRQW